MDISCKLCNQFQLNWTYFWHIYDLACFMLLKISGPTDVSNFDHYPDITDVPPDELSGWDAEF